MGGEEEEELWGWRAKGGSLREGGERKKKNSGVAGIWGVKGSSREGDEEEKGALRERGERGGQKVIAGSFAGFGGPDRAKDS